MVLAHFVVSDDVGRSRRFYTYVLGGRTVISGEATDAVTYVALANSWIIINVGGGPTDDSDCSGPRPRVVIGQAWSGCEGSVRDRSVLRAAGGARGGPGADDRSAAGSDRRAGCADRGAGAAAGRLFAQFLQAAVERRAGQAGAKVAARPVRAQAGWSARAGGSHAAAGRRPRRSGGPRARRLSRLRREADRRGPAGRGQPAAGVRHPADHRAGGRARPDLPPLWRVRNGHRRGRPGRG